MAYAAALAASEVAERALIDEQAPEDQKGTAFGLYYLLASLLALPGALLFGRLRERYTSDTAFLAAALVTAVAALGMVFARGRHAG